jgi:multicomponent Na+:H+ antiporter subunit D
MLPYPVDFHPYEIARVVAMMQLLLATLAAFIIYIKKLGGEPTVSIDTDWFYRVFGKVLQRFCNNSLETVRSTAQQLFVNIIRVLSGPAHYPYQWIDMISKSPSRKDKNTIHRVPIGAGAGLSLVLLCILILIGLIGR